MNFTTLCAKKAGIIQQPHIGLLILGRKREGFDPVWGAAMKQNIITALQKLPWKLTIPSENITDEAELRHAIGACGNVSVLIAVQPTISDGRLAPLLFRLWQHPVILWATPEKPTGRMISANSLVGTHVMAATLRQLDMPLEIIVGSPEDTALMQKLRTSIRAAHAAHSIQKRIIGLVGYHAPGFVDFHADPVFLHNTLGSQLYHMSTAELIQRVQAYSDDDIQEERTVFVQHSVSQEFTDADKDGTALSMQARYYRAFRELFAEQCFDALAFRCWPDLPTVLGHWPYLALARLVSEGFPIAMEGDVDGALCSRIAESADIGPVYLSDWLEHDEHTITIWHTGAAPFQLAASKPEPYLSVQFNNKLPTVVESTIAPDMQATLFRIWRFQEKYCFTAIEGKTIPPRRPLMATNGLFHTDKVDVRDWFEEMVQNGMPHHVCFVQGHHKALLKRAARLLRAVWI